MSDALEAAKAARDEVYTLAAAYQDALDRRDATIRAALKAGERVADLVTLTGLNRSRIYQIVTAERG